tara:strand:- start:2478 stop:2690 length:213 start_codon:yes stop_codon:yes gene_type:complete
VSILKVKDHKNLVRDTRSKAILNTDLLKMREAKRRKRQDITLETLTQEVNTIKNEFQEIKSLLKQIAKKS